MLRDSISGGGIRLRNGHVSARVNIQTIQGGLWAKKEVLFSCSLLPFWASAASQMPRRPLPWGYQEPENLNTYIGVQTVITYVHKPFAEYLIDVNEKGEYSPVLAAEVPSVENGGIQRLAAGLQAAQGSEMERRRSVHFRRRQVHLGGGRRPEEPGQEQIGLRPDPVGGNPDEHTAIVTYKEFYAPYLTPLHPCCPSTSSAAQDINDAPYNRMPVGTGPFMVTEWAPATTTPWQQP